MKIVVIKSMIYDGVRYEVGDEILPSLISNRKLRTLETGRFVRAIGDGDAITIVANDAVSEPFVATYEKNGNGAQISLTNDRLTKVFRVLQTPVVEADEAVAALEGDNELIDFVYSVENRKTVVKKLDDRFGKR